MEKNSSDSFSLEVRNRVAGLRVEQRADETPSRTIVGYAAVFDSWSDPINGWFKEKIDRHAFDDCDMSDVIMCFNHSINDLLARGVDGIHLYTMNHPCVTRRIWANVQDLFA